MSKARILIVEDEQIIAFNLQNKLELLGYIVPAYVSSGEEAVEKAEELKPDLVLMDILLQGDMDGVDAAKLIQDKFEIPIVYITASSDDETVERAKKTQPVGYIIKPFEENMLRITLEMALYKIKMEKRLRQTEEAKQVLKAQLIQSQKLEAIGTMAGGVAHEINNPLMGIINYAQLIYDNIVEHNNLKEYSSEIIKEGERIAKIVKNLLAFSRQEKENKREVSITEMVDAVMSITRRLIQKDEIKLIINIPNDLPNINCRNQQIEQVIINLIMNARDALNQKYPEYNENKIMKIEAEEIISEDKIKFIRIIVEDHGTGIRDELEGKLFDPFFSTKPKNQGTGLGLSVSYGIVQEHSGKLSFETTDNEFTKFFLDLPL